MKEIPLSNGGVALVDDEDYERIASAGTWRRSSRGYAIRSSRGTKFHMHREIMGNVAGTADRAGDHRRTLA